ncbi:MAG: lipoprotein [Gammaproteobacteria bacterium]|nr:lipoprotein [Gammaproteobacteria bacterium]
MRKVLLLLICLAVLCGCGFKGPLELPSPIPDESEPDNAPASS